ncbi:SusC/RagA family TonB-linked outer membrane protein [Tellurirhabdus bombi]|uniref:SusC/RagA family TonB-linked outer membrane protein n=1 Tax=Tellurirhabdus bombi TaxID=2907205 RepID=UPI001F421C68|nr:SusC/RagA family TonB-linked outer membrane protein [Tellurirhabdus bombi]
MRKLLRKHLFGKQVCLIAGLLMVDTCLPGHLNSVIAKPIRSDVRVSGKVTSDDGEALPGVSIIIKGTTTGTVTGSDGSYQLSVPDGGVLKFSFIGYTTQEITVGRQTLVNVVLARDQKQLDEVVVVGYGTQRRGDVTSSIASVKSEDFIKGFARDPAQLIQGKVAGLSISTPSGNPTANTQISLRGITSLKGSTTPLILIDGIPGNLNTVAPEDIESIDILKDGSAAAIYGTRGTNGVILITTKKNRGASRSTIDYNGYLSVQSIARRPEFLTGDDYRRLIGEGVNFVNYGGSTDWFKEITRTPVSHVHNLTFQGGNSTTNFTASLNYRDLQGIFLKSDNKQVTGRVDVNHSMFDGRLRANLSAISRSRNYWTGGDGSSFNNYVYRQAVIRNPTDSVRNARGWIERDGYFYDNPVAYINESSGENKDRELRLNGSLTWSPIDNLNIKLLVSGNKFTQIRGYAESKRHVSTVKNGRNGYASRGTDAWNDNLTEFTTDYSKTFGNHRISALGGYSYQDYDVESFYMQNWDFPTDLYSYNRMQSGNALSRGEAVMNSGKSSWKLIGFFGRVNYNWANKYMLMASVRREGSSKFGANHKWGWFPAISAGWRINQEEFMKGVTLFNDLKLRGGFGITGVIPDNSYQSLTSLNYGSRFLSNGVWIQGLSPVRNPNPDLRWERKEEFNVGLDFALLDSRISGSIDVYQRTTKDALWDYQVPVPPYLFNSIQANVGVIQNKGFEALVNIVPFKNSAIQWNTNVTYSTNSNRLVSLSNDQFRTTNNFFLTGGTGEPVQESTHRVEIGGPIGNFFGYKVVDIDADGRWLVESAKGEIIPIKNAKPDDKKILGNGLPKHILAWNNSVQYKSFDLNVTMRGAFGFQILNFQRMFYENPKVVQYNMLKSAFDPVFGKTRLNNDLAYVDYYVENGDYWKIDNVTLGYTPKIAKTKWLRGARFYVSGLNLLTITGYKGIDPEGVNRSGLSPGNDERDKYPTTRTFTAGVNLGF